MKKLALIIMLSLTIPASVAAGEIPRHPGQTNVVALSGLTHEHATVVRSKRSVPWNARVYVDARFNGHKPQVVYSSTRWQISFAWKGVIAVATCQKRSAPVQINIASARVGGKPVHVRVTFAWED